MGLMDILNGLTGTPAQDGNNAAAPAGDYSALLALLPQLLQQAGGLQGLLAKFEQGGLANAAQSWVSQGQNMPLSGQQLEQTLGSDLINQLASKAGIDSSTASQQLAALLPKAIDAMTPEGKLPANNDLLAQGMDFLKNRLG